VVCRLRSETAGAALSEAIGFTFTDGDKAACRTTFLHDSEPQRRAALRSLEEGVPRT
jgi:hypothetical protein